MSENKVLKWGQEDEMISTDLGVNFVVIRKVFCHLTGVSLEWCLLTQSETAKWGLTLKYPIKNSSITPDL